MERCGKCGAKKHEKPRYWRSRYADYIGGNPHDMCEGEPTPVLDEGQVRMHGGKPCYAILPGNPHEYCGRADYWGGHGVDHDFVAEPKRSNEAIDTPQQKHVI